MSGTQRKRILFVDDEESIRETMTAVLSAHGFEATAVGRIDEALAQITAAHFDVLISDLNIGHPGDGFVVVSAMRRTQPSCVTLILTGYPGFETALQAIRSQVDDYLIKPTSVPTLIKLIEGKLQKREASEPVANKRIAVVLRENIFEITQRVLKDMKSDPHLGKLLTSDKEHIGYLPIGLLELAKMLESDDPNESLEKSLKVAESAGEKRHHQGYTPVLLAIHLRLLQRAIYDVIRENLLSLNLSYLMLDLRQLNESLGIYFEVLLSTLLQAERREPSKSADIPS
jgi:YesN/AraC family two-component response regulator